MAMIDLRITSAWWDEFEDPPGHRAEVIRGELVLSPSASRAHQNAVMRLLYILGDACPEGFEVLPDLEWRLERGGFVAQAPRPDLLVLPAVLEPIVEPPLLIVEVLSQSDYAGLGAATVSRIEGKVADYAMNGLVHYLEISLEPATAALFDLSQGPGEMQLAYAAGDEVLDAGAPFAFSFRPSDLLYRP